MKNNCRVLFIKRFLILIGFLIIARPLSAKIISGAVSGGLGNAGVGLFEPSDSVFVNPAMLAMLPGQHIGLTFMQDQQNLRFSDNSKDVMFPGSLGYSQMKLSTELEQKNFHLDVAHGWAEARIFLGVDLQHRTWRLTKLEKNYTQTVANFGVFYVPLKWLSLGATMEDVALTDTILPDAEDKAVRTMVGFGVGNETFARFRLDVGTVSQQANSNYIYRGGLQTKLNEWILTSVGYENNNIVGSKALTVGAGFDGPQFGLFYAYQKEANDVFEPRHVIDLSVPF